MQQTVQDSGLRGRRRADAVCAAAQRPLCPGRARRRARYGSGCVHHAIAQSSVCERARTGGRQTHVLEFRKRAFECRQRRRNKTSSLCVECRGHRR